LTLADWNGAARPERITLTGRYVRLEPIDGERHAADLLAASLAPGVEDRFRYLFDEPPADLAGLTASLAKASASLDPLFFAVIDPATGRAEGRQTLMRIEPRHGVIEIGSILWGPAIARSRAATEAFYLFACYVFDTLRYRRLEWKCDAHNLPSRRAALRFGFTFEGVFRQHMVVKGKNRDTAWFAIIDSDWPRLNAGYEAWLDPSNFDGSGRQHSRLSF
jgi:RimJ/RimL family protein N-acetyltransferase